MLKLSKCEFWKWKSAMWLKTRSKRQAHSIWVLSAGMVEERKCAKGKMMHRKNRVRVSRDEGRKTVEKENGRHLQR